MSDKRDFLNALKAFKDEVKGSTINPIDVNIIMTYDHETKEITAVREGWIDTRDPTDPGGGSGSGGGNFPP